MPHAMYPARLEQEGTRVLIMKKFAPVAICFALGLIIGLNFQWLRDAIISRIHALAGDVQVEQHQTGSPGNFVKAPASERNRVTFISSKTCMVTTRMADPQKCLFKAKLHNNSDWDISSVVFILTTKNGVSREYKARPCITNMIPAGVVDAALIDVGSTAAKYVESHTFHVASSKSTFEAICEIDSTEASLNAAAITEIYGYRP